MDEPNCVPFTSPTALLILTSLNFVCVLEGNKGEKEREGREREREREAGREGRVNKKQFVLIV